MQCVNHPEVDQGVVRCLRCRHPFCPDCVVMLRGYWYCAACKEEQVRDIRSGTTSPLELASMGRRFAAAVLDGIVTSTVAAVLMLPLYFLIFGAALFGAGAAERSPQRGPEADAAVGLAMVALYPIMFLIGLGIPLVYEGLMLQRRGQTLGKMALSIRVVTPAGEHLTRGQAWGRSAVKSALSTMCSCLGLLADALPAFFTAERTTLHDMASRTRVVRVG